MLKPDDRIALAYVLVLLSFPEFFHQEQIIITLFGLVGNTNPLKLSQKICVVIIILEYSRNIVLCCILYPRQRTVCGHYRMVADVGVLDSEMSHLITVRMLLL